MTLKRYDGAAFQNIAAIKRWDGAAWVDLTVLKRWDGAAWVDIGLPGGGGGLSATVSPATVSKVHVAASPAAVTLTTTAPAVVTASGGNDPYTYAWTYVSGDSAIYPVSPTSNSSYFRGIVYQYSTVSAVWRCTVTDDDDATTTVDVNILLQYEGTD